MKYVVLTLFIIILNLQPVYSSSRPTSRHPYFIDSNIKKTYTYKIDAKKNCIFLSKRENIPTKVVKVMLKLNTKYIVSVTGEAFFSPETGKQVDPMPGVVVFYTDNTQDGFATKYTVLTPDSSFISFTTPSVDKKNVFLIAFVMDCWGEGKSVNKGHYILKIEELLN